MKTFLDTNVLLDVLLHREPFFRPAAAIWSLAERGEITGLVSAISYNNVYYVIRKQSGPAVARQALALLRDCFRTIVPTQRILDRALDSDIADFEDAIQFHSAVAAGASFVITCDPHDFPSRPLTVLAPDEFLAIWSARSA